MSNFLGALLTFKGYIVRATSHKPVTRYARVRRLLAMERKV